MTKERVDERVDHLVNLLDLKRCKTQIKNLRYGGYPKLASRQTMIPFANY